MVSSVIPSKYGGFRTYVDASFHSKVAPVGVGSVRHRSSPSKTLAYSCSNMSVEIEESIVACTSDASGQMSFRKTSLPSLSRPSGSVSKSKFMLPASAYAMTSGGLAR